MPDFFYKARDRNGKQIKGVMAATDEMDLANVLRGKGLYLVYFKEKKENKKSIGSIGFGKVTRRDLIEFTVHLATVLSAGVPILQGLQDLEAQTKNPRFREVIRRIREDINAGSSLHSALSNHPRIFPPVYVNMVKAGEASGNVDMILQELVGFLQWQEELTSNIKKATTYPLMVLVAVFLLMGLLFAFAFPRITGVLVAMKVPLPFITKTMIGISTFFKAYWWILFFGLAAAAIGLRAAAKTPKGRLWVDKLKLRLPVVGGLIRKIALSRFAHHLGLLWRAGIDIGQALTLVEHTVGNQVIARAISQAKEEVLAGGSLYESLKKTGQFSPLVMRMISIGETTGEIDKSLAEVSEYYDREVPATIKKMFSIMEPLLIVFLALIVLTVALSIYLPLYTALSHFGR